MNGTDLMQFGFNEMSVSSSVFEVIPSTQTYLNDEPFTCPISKDVWKSQILHNARCHYKYCKGKWDFSHNFVVMNPNI